MAAKERNTNPVPGDLINLRLIAYNSNNYANVQSIQQVDIYFLDPTGQTCDDDCTKTLIQTLPGSQVITDDVGNYHLPLQTTVPQYVVGNYLDQWTLIFNANDTPSTIQNHFQLYTNLWYTSTTPAVYGFGFNFQPNRIRQGSIKWLIIQIVPNVPRATDLERYYTNLAIAADLKITIQQACGPCLPTEQDLRTIVDAAPVTIRDKVFGFYQLDTTQLDCGIYDVWFELDYAGSIDISPKYQLQVF